MCRMLGNGQHRFKYPRAGHASNGAEIRLCAKMSDGSTIEGESEIAAYVEKKGGK